MNRCNVELGLQHMFRVHPGGCSSSSSSLVSESCKIGRVDMVLLKLLSVRLTKSIKEYYLISFWLHEF